MFECGRVFACDKSTETGLAEKDQVGIALCQETADFTAMKQFIDALLLSLGLEGSVRESSHPSFIEGRMGEIVAENTVLGIIGEIHPAVLEQWGITVPVVAAEINVERLFGLAKE